MLKVIIAKRSNIYKTKLSMRNYIASVWSLLNIFHILYFLSSARNVSNMHVNARSEYIPASISSFC